MSRSKSRPVKKEKKVENKEQLLVDYFDTELRYLEDELALKKTLIEQYRGVYIEALRNSEHSSQKIENQIKQIESDEQTLPVFEIEKKHGITVSQLKQRLTTIVEQEYYNRQSDIEGASNRYTKDRAVLVTKLATDKDKLVKLMNRNGVKQPAGLVGNRG